MTLNAVRPVGRCDFTLAGILFSIHGAIAPAALAPFFTPFLDDLAQADLRCAVNELCPDHLLTALPDAPDEGWSFSRPAGRYQVIRRDRQGQAVWLISGDTCFETASVH